MRCGAKSRAKSVTLGDALANTVPLRAVGAAIGDGRRVRARTRPVGRAARPVPTHTICCAPLGSPVLSSALPIWPALRVVREHADAAAHHRARCARRADEAADLLRGAERPRETDARAERDRRRHAIVAPVRTRCSTSGLNAGAAVKWLPSTRTPYWICRSGVRRYESPSESAPVNCPVERWRAVSVRVNDAGRPASRSPSELKVKVPSRLVAWSCVLPLNRSSVVSLMRCLLASSNQESVFWNVPSQSCASCVNSPWLPPNASVCTPLAPSSSIGVDAHAPRRQVEIRLAVVARDAHARPTVSLRSIPR